MAYTLLRVTGAGVALLAGHRRRLAAEPGADLAAFDDFARTAAPGVYAVTLHRGGLHAEARPGSRLFDGVPVRFAPSPAAGSPGPFAKPAPPCLYDAVRVPGVATILTTADGYEILEACVAAVLGFDGRAFVAVPGDRPRVLSVAEDAVRATLPVREAPLLVADALPLVLVNAVKGPCRAAFPGRPPFPDAAFAALAAALRVE